MSVELSWTTRIIAAAIGIGAIVVIAVALWPAKPIHEDVTPAPQVIQSDGSVIAERKPAPKVVPKAPHVIPRGYVEERRETVHVAPDPSKDDVEIDLSLVRKGDERRVIASTPDGTIVSALDMPIEPAIIPPAPKPWAAGLAYGSDHSVGAWIERDVGRLRVGAEVAKGQGKPRAELRVGVSW